MALDHKLPPLDLTEDVEAFQAYSESKDVSNLRRCKHNKTRIDNGTLRCVCGAQWSGTRHMELKEVLDTKDILH